MSDIAMDAELARLELELEEAYAKGYHDGFMSSGEGYNGELYKDGWESVIKGHDKDLSSLSNA